MKVWVYIDGFNLYNGIVRATPYRWLNLHKLAEVLLPRDTIEKVKYFTAKVTDRPGDPNQRFHQMQYWRALRTLPTAEIIEGHFLAGPKQMPVRESVLPATLTDARGSFSKPASW